MIEIPNLEQPAYAQHELDRLQQQYNQTQDSDLSSQRDLPALGTGTDQGSMIQPGFTTPQLISRVTLELPVNFLDFANSPYVPLPRLINNNQSPMVVDLYFSSQKNKTNGLLTSRYTIEQTPNAAYLSDPINLNMTNIDEFSELDVDVDVQSVGPTSQVRSRMQSEDFLADTYRNQLEEPPATFENASAFMISAASSGNLEDPVQLADYNKELEVEPQELAYDATLPVRMVQKNSTDDPNILEKISKLHVTQPDATPLLERFPHTPVESTSITPRMTSYTLNLMSPSSPGRHEIEPSPQLPPPLSSKSLKLVSPQVDEFTQMRKLMATETKNPAEYTLHILFTQFVRHAERKLNLCLEFPVQKEPPIIDLLAEGVDELFDNVIASLGHIAKREPKPVIDSVMFWRKSKSEVAVMASAEVEKVLNLISAFQSSARLGSGSSKDNFQPQPLPKALLGRGKRSLSLMRTKSISNLTHKRNASASVVGSNQQPALDLRKLDAEQMQRKEYLDKQLVQARNTAVQAERKSLASIYILCRVLIEVIKQTSPAALDSDLGRKLEEIVYNQLKTTDPIATSESFVRLANWNLFSELLGFMSAKRFLSVSDRFIADLEKVPSNIKHEDEPRVHLLIHGMRYLKLTNYPLEKFEESAEFIQSLTKFFCNSNHPAIVMAYAEVLSGLILPLAPLLTAEANHPLWVEAITQIHSKSYKLWLQSANSPQHYATNTNVSGISQGRSSSSMDGDIPLILMSSALSVSSKELFDGSWFLFIEANDSRLKPKVDVASKTTYMICIARLVWVYINRLPDTLNNTTKKLDKLFDILFFNHNASAKKQHWITLDIDLMNAITSIIRIVAFQHFSYVQDNVILRLLRENFNGSLEGIGIEKVMLVIRAYGLCLRDHKLGEKPEFPTDDVLDNQFREISLMECRQSSTDLFGMTQNKTFQKRNKDMFGGKKIKNFDAHEEVCRTISALLKLLDNLCGVTNLYLTETVIATPNQSKTFSSMTAFPFGIESFHNNKAVQAELFAALLYVATWTLTPLIKDLGSINQMDMSLQQMMEILIRNATHSDFNVASASVQALAKLASRKDAGGLLTTYARVAFKITDKMSPTYDSEFFTSAKFFRLLRIYVDLLKCWEDQFSGDSSDSQPVEGENGFHLPDEGGLSDLYEINFKAPDLTNVELSAKSKPSMDLGWKSIITVIEEIEGNGLYFLCSDDFRVRQSAVAVLKIVEQFDRSIYLNTDKPEKDSDSQALSDSKTHSRSSSKYVADEGSRLIHVIESTDLFELIKPLKKELSGPERTRLGKIKNKKGIILRFATSDNGIDSTIWLRIYPRLLDSLFECCPMPIAICRSIVCGRLVQMHELIVALSECSKGNAPFMFGKSISSTAPEVVINQWKLYLIFACCTLTSTNEQKISIPTQPKHGRKKSLPMYIQHQRITSAKSVYRMVLPLLKSTQSIIREAVIAGLSCININTCKTFLENLPDSMTKWDALSKSRNTVDDKFRIEIVQILSIVTGRFKNNALFYTDKLVISSLVEIIKTVKGFLSHPSVQTLSEFQRLRFYFTIFLENVFLGLQGRKESDIWLPFEAKIGCFNFLLEWSGFGDSKTVLDERYNLMVAKAQQMKDAATIVAILELEKKTFQIASLSCMATICATSLKHSFDVPGKVAVISFDSRSVMNWIYDVISSDVIKIQDIGKVALKNVFSSNYDNNEVYSESLRQCYSSQNSLRVKEIYFTALVDAAVKQKASSTMPIELFCISTFLVGANSYEIRSAAIRCVQFIEKNYLNSSHLELFTENVCCSTMVVYKKVLFDMSMKLASLHAKDAFIYISYLTKYFNVVDNSTRRDILACLLPWVQTVELKYASKSQELPPVEDKGNMSMTMESTEIDTPSHMVLNNLFEITVKFSKLISNEVEALWVALGTNSSNFDLVFDYIVRSCLRKRNSGFVSHSRQIVAYLVFSKPESSYIIHKLIENLQPKAMIPFQQEVVEDFENFTAFPYTADLIDTLPSNSKETAFSLGQLSMIFLVDLFCSKNDMVVDHLPLLFHVCFSLLDHYYPLVQSQAASMLIQLIYMLSPNHPKASKVLEQLRSHDHHANLWLYDDLSNDKKSGITPRNMDLMIRTVLELFTPAAPNLQRDWGRISLKWATTCAVRHIACRSFQIFRSLLSFLDQSMLKDMLHRLSNTVADDLVDIQGFAMQILMTTNAITAELGSGELIDFPQLFWSSVACLSTVHEHEFIEAISMMSKFVSKIDLDAPDTISCLISTFPSKWEGKFEGLQDTVLIGLRSATAWEPTLKFLDKLSQLRDSGIIGLGDDRLFITVFANLPRFLHALDNRVVSPEIERACLVISEMAIARGKATLARILTSLAKSRFRSKKDFLVQTVSCVKECFFPQYEARGLVLLLSLLTNKISWVRLETLRLLKQVVPLIDLRREEFAGVGADLISPLLRLLLTDYAEAALEVIDQMVTISGSQLDKDFLRMSMANSFMKKEYDRTASLFGIPDESGWAVPMPAMTAARTRHNIHAVFATCTESSVKGETRNDSLGDEDIKFLMEDYYAPQSELGDAASVLVEDPAASLSNMWAALDDFDSFFTKTSEQRVSMLNTVRKRQQQNQLQNQFTRDLQQSAGGVQPQPRLTHAYSLSTDTRNSNSSDLQSPIESVPQVYDKKALLILNRSLARTQSNTSFKSSLADNFGSPKGAEAQEANSTRRSYLPFRNSRVMKKDPLTTPVMGNSGFFDQGAVAMTTRTSSRGSPPTGVPLRSPNSLELQPFPDATNFDGVMRFGGRKKNRKG